MSDTRARMKANRAAGSLGLLLAIATSGCQGSWDYRPPAVSSAELEGAWVDQEDGGTLVVFGEDNEATVCDFPAKYLTFAGTSGDGERVSFEAGFEILDGVEVQVGARQGSAYSGALVEFSTQGDESNTTLYAQRFGDPDSSDVRIFEKVDSFEAETVETCLS